VVGARRKIMFGLFARGVEDENFPSHNSTALSPACLHLHLAKKEKKKTRINTTKRREKSLLNVQEMSRSKHQSARDVNEK
jgi:hypothetical protein